MFDMLDILEAVLALVTILGCVMILFAPFIAYAWCERHEGPKHADARRGFEVLNPHPADAVEDEQTTAAK
jgi:hypothetical protein